MEHLNLEESVERKEAGIAAATESPLGMTWLEYIRGIAITIAVAGDGTCNADQVHAKCIQWGVEVPKGPFWGALFSLRGDWVFTGKRIRSAQPNNHARELKVWRLI